jgi:predicted  nucleic acid-binding Zn-ribbon protein
LVGHDGAVTAPAFEALIALQEIDTTLDQMRHRRQHLPARAELTEVARQRTELEVRRRRAEGPRDELAGRQSHLEDELASTEKRSREVSARLYGGEVSASRDLQALAADIELLNQRASDLEDTILGVLDEREPLDAVVSAIDAAAADLDRREIAAMGALAEGENEVDAETAALDEQRRVAAPLVPDDLRAIYERLRPRLGGIAAARLIGRHCGGCHLELPAQELDGVRHLPPDAIAYCDQCGRILVRP